MIHPRHDRAAGIYLHVPFRSSPSSVSLERSPPGDDSESLHRRYADALIDEYEARRDRLADRDVQSLYIGGPEPSCWHRDALNEVLQHLRGDVALDAIEVTLEVAPADVDAERLEAWNSLGIERLNLDVGSLQPDVRHHLEHRFGASYVFEILEKTLARESLNVGVDLVFGAPGQSLETWQSDVERTTAFDALSHATWREWEETSGGRGKDSSDAPSEATRLDMLHEAVETSRRRGFERYELGSVARPGGACRHNTLYWIGGEYLGLGLGAHSFDLREGTPTRRSNPGDLESYLAAPTRPGRLRTIAPEDYFVQRIALAMRTRQGLAFQEVRSQFEDALSETTLDRTLDVLEPLVDRGLLTRDALRYRPTDRALEVEDTLSTWLARRLPPAS